MSFCTFLYESFNSYYGHNYLNTQRPKNESNEIQMRKHWENLLKRHIRTAEAVVGTDGLTVISKSLVISKEI